MVTEFGILVSITSGTVGLLTVLLGVIIRITVKWTTTQEQMRDITSDLRDIADRTQREMAGLDRRLRFMEEKEMRGHAKQ